MCGFLVNLEGETLCFAQESSPSPMNRRALSARGKSLLRLGPDTASNSPATTGKIAQLSARGQKLFFSGTVDVNASGSSTAEGSLALGFGPGLKQIAGHASDSGGGKI